METASGSALDGAGPQGLAPSEGADDAPPPTRVDGLELLGEHASSGHRQAPSLARRADGQMVQLTPLLYRVLQAVDGRSQYPGIASAVSRSVGRTVTADGVRFLVESKLRPLGLIGTPGRSMPGGPRANPLLAIRGRVAVVNPERSRRLASRFTWLFRPVIMPFTLLAAVLTSGWVLFERGLAAPARQALYEPQLLLLIFALTVMSAAFHELGHAAACVYGGARPGAMGAGLYIVWPAFYTDVTDSYRLDRRGRLRVDLGGIYFNAVFALGATLLWGITRWDAVLLVVPIQLLLSLRQLPPFIRLDGYHILADLTGVPDLYAHIKPVLLDLLPTRWGRSESSALRPWVRVVVTLWVLLVVPVLVGSLLMMAIAFPAMVATAWDSLGLQWLALRGALADAQLAGVVLSIVLLFTVALPVLGVPYIVGRIVQRTGRSVWRATDGRPVRRGTAILVAAAMAVGLGAAWWPDGQYHPIDAHERGALQDGVRAIDLAPRVLAPSQDAPAARGLLPRATTSAGTVADGRTSFDGAVAWPMFAGTPADGAPQAEWRPPWAVRFNPPQPGEGDNFAIALNTSDLTTVLDFAFSLVHADGTVVDQSNRAYALANCMACVAVAIAFQLVLISDSANVVIPDNLAVAVNGSCVSCVTYALAIQLVVSLTGPLSDGAVGELDQLWERLAQLEAQLGGAVPIAEAEARLTAIEADIVQVLVEDGAVARGPSVASDDGSTSADSPSSTGSTTTTPTGSTSPEETTTTTTSPDPSPTTSTTDPSTTTTTTAG